MNKFPVVYWSVHINDLGDLKLPSEPSPIGLNIIVTGEPIETEMLTQLLNRSQVQILLTLSGSIITNISTDRLHNIYLLYSLCRPSLHIYDTLLIDDRHGTNQKNLDLIASYFSKQSENSLQSLLYSSIINGEEKIGLMNAKDIIGFDLDALTVTSQAGLLALIAYVSEQGKELLPLLLQSLDSNLYLNLFCHEAGVRLQLLQAKHEISKWQKRSLLYLSFLNMGKEAGKEDYKAIQEWYDKEYEVLPIWYKRTGHVLKVIMGKRSFASLFDDSKKP